MLVEAAQSRNMDSGPAQPWTYCMTKLPDNPTGLLCPVVSPKGHQCVPHQLRCVQLPQVSTVGRAQNSGN